MHRVPLVRRVVVSLAFTLAQLLAASKDAACQQVGSVSPSEGTLGTLISVSGVDLDISRPKLFLQFTNPATGKLDKHALKIVSLAGTAISAEIVKAQAGPCTLHLVWRDGAQASAPFEIKLPHVTGVSPSVAVPGQAVTLTGTHFGSKAVKVNLLDQRARVLSVSDTSLVIEVPKKGLPDGTFTPLVTNAVGADWADAAVVVSGSSAAWPPDFVKAALGGVHFFAPPAGISAAFVPGPKLAFDAYQDGAFAGQISLLLPFNLATTMIPASYSGSGFGNQPLFVQVTLDGSANAGQTVYTVKPGVQPWSVVIVGKGGQHVAGILQATLLRVSGDGPDTLTLSNGRFLVTP